MAAPLGALRLTKNVSLGSTLVFEISKKMLLAQATLSRACVVATLGTVMAWLPSFGVPAKVDAFCTGAVITDRESEIQRARVGRQ